jgi:glycerate dehydrogenase
MNIVVLDGRTLAAADNPWTPLLALGCVEIFDHSPEDLIPLRVRGAGVVVTNKAPITRASIEQAVELRFIAVSATGYDCVDVTAARDRGIAVANVPEYGTDSVAQFVFALLLELCHRVGLHASAVQAGEWTLAPEFCFWKTPQIELAGKTMGIVGLGRIGRRVATLAGAFGMNVLGHSRTHHWSPSAGEAEGSFAWADLDTLFARADVISLHCPLTEETAGLVDRRRLSLAKTGCWLINTARGGLIVERDLADALNEGRLAAAALDVVSQEPILPDNPLLTARNCLITPHIAWATREARRRLLTATVANLASFLAGRPVNIVN